MADGTLHEDLRREDATAAPSERKFGWTLGVIFALIAIVKAVERSEWSFASQRRLLEAWIKTLSSDGPVARTLFGLIANWRSISKPIHRSRLTSSMLPQRVPISSVSSR